MHGTINIKLTAYSCICWLFHRIYYDARKHKHKIFIFHYIFLRLAKQSQFIPLQNVVYFITLPFLIRKMFTFYISDVLLLKSPVPGPKG